MESIIQSFAHLLSYSEHSRRLRLFIVDFEWCRNMAKQTTNIAKKNIISCFQCRGQSSENFTHQHPVAFLIQLLNLFSCFDAINHRHLSILFVKLCLHCTFESVTTFHQSVRYALDALVLVPRYSTACSMYISQPSHTAWMILHI